MDHLERVRRDITTQRRDRRHFLPGKSNLTIVERKHRAHARHPLRTRQVDIAHPRMRPRTAQNRPIKHPRQFDIVSIPSSPGSLQRAINPRRRFTNNRKPLAQLPRRRLIVRNYDGNSLRITLKSKIERNPPRHQETPCERTARDILVLGFAAFNAASKTCE